MTTINDPCIDPYKDLNCPNCHLSDWSLYTSEIVINTGIRIVCKNCGKVAIPWICPCGYITILFFGDEENTCYFRCEIERGEDKGKIYCMKDWGVDKSVIYLISKGECNLCYHEQCSKQDSIVT